MTEQELAEIRARVEAERGKTFLAAATVEGSTRLGAGNQARADREALLAEVERLRAENAALREIAEFGREVARELASPRWRIAGTQVVHLHDELMARARALLSGETHEQEQERTKASE